MHITIVAGTRPNFIKISPIIKAIEKAKKSGDTIDYSLVHTGQHYDKAMSSSFFEQLNIPTPNINLGVKTGTQTQQTAEIMVSFEEYLNSISTDAVLVVGDVNSTMACSVVAKKLKLKLIHVEGGIRSFDNEMPEEINRKITDSITDLFFTTSEFANKNLRKEGIEEEQIHFVGNVMIDTLTELQCKFEKPTFFDDNNLEEKGYYMLTLHRPRNVDDPSKLLEFLTVIDENCGGKPVVFPVHPRTAKVMEQQNMSFTNIIPTTPYSYLEFNYLVKNSFAVITDSGGITEETTVMKVPCITLRANTERPETCTIGTNELVGTDSAKVKDALIRLESKQWKEGGIPEKWDGKAAERIIEVLLRVL